MLDEIILAVKKYRLSREQASAVLDEMGLYGLDFSECTRSQFNAHARRCADIVFGDKTRAQVTQDNARHLNLKF